MKVMYQNVKMPVFYSSIFWLIIFVLLCTCSQISASVPPFEFSAVPYGASGGPFDIAVSDLDGDGWDDFVAITAGGGWQCFYRQPGNSFSSGTYWGLSGYPPRDIVCVDLNSDSKSDIIFSSGNSVIVSLSTGTDDGNVDYIYSDPGTIQASAMTTGDFNGDQKEDVAVVWGTTITLMYNSGSGGFTWGFYDTGDTFGQLAAADFDKDGLLDIVGISGTGISVLYNQSSGSFSNRTDYDLQIPGGSDTDIETADLDNDGYQDVAVCFRKTIPNSSPVSQMSKLIVLYGQPGGSLGDRQDYSWPNGSSGDWPGHRLTTGDLNKDGYLDFALSYRAGMSNASLEFVYQTAPRTFGSPTYWDIGADSTTSDIGDIAAVDLGKDGTMEVIVPVNKFLGSDKVYVLWGQPEELSKTLKGEMVSSWEANADHADFQGSAYEGGVVLASGTSDSKPTYRFVMPNPRFSPGFRQLEEVKITIYGEGGNFWGQSAGVIIGGQVMSDLGTGERANEYLFSGANARSLLYPNPDEVNGEEVTWYLDVTIDARGNWDWYDVRDVTLNYTYLGVDTELLARIDQVLTGREMINRFAEYHDDYLVQGGLVLDRCGKGIQAELARQCVSLAASVLPGEWGQAIEGFRSSSIYEKYVAPHEPSILEYNGLYDSLATVNWWIWLKTHVAVNSDFPADLQQASDALLGLAQVYSNAASSGQMVGYESQINANVVGAVEEVNDIVNGEFGSGTVLSAMRESYNVHTPEQYKPAAKNAADGYVATLAPLVKWIYNIDTLQQDRDDPNSYLWNYANILEKQIINYPPTDITLSNSTVLENQPVGTTVGTFSTIDPLGESTFSYTLVGGDIGFFSINGNALVTASSFDFEFRDNYSIQVRSTDSAGLYIEENFTISVTDVSENPNIAGGNKVNFEDYAILAKSWNEINCNENNDWCEKADIDKSGMVDFEDLLIMAENWLAHSASLVHQDDFSLDTTANYETFQLNYGSVIATVSVNHDATNERAILTTLGGYNWGYMKVKQKSLIPAHADFDFSVDFDTLSGYTTTIYLGDLQPLASADYIELRANSHAHTLDVILRKNGTDVYLFREPYNGTSGNIRVRRTNDEYFFYYNDNLFFNDTFEEFDEMDLHYAVGNHTGSGSSPSQTVSSAIDNWDMDF